MYSLKERVPMLMQNGFEGVCTEDLKGLGEIHVTEFASR